MRKAVEIENSRGEKPSAILAQAIYAEIPIKLCETL